MTSVLLMSFPCFLTYLFSHEFLRSLNLSLCHLITVAHSSHCCRDEVARCRRSTSGPDPPSPRLQPICRFSLASTSLFDCTCLQELPVVGLRSSFVASGTSPLDQFFVLFSAPLPLRSTDTDLRSGFAAITGLASLGHFFSLFCFGIPAPRV